VKKYPIVNIESMWSEDANTYTHLGVVDFTNEWVDSHYPSVQYIMYETKKDTPRKYWDESMDLQGSMIFDPHPDYMGALQFSCLQKLAAVAEAAGDIGNAVIVGNGMGAFQNYLRVRHYGALESCVGIEINAAVEHLRRKYLPAHPGHTVELADAYEKLKQWRDIQLLVLDAFLGVGNNDLDPRLAEEATAKMLLDCLATGQTAFQPGSIVMNLNGYDRKGNYEIYMQLFQHFMHQGYLIHLFGVDEMEIDNPIALIEACDFSVTKWRREAMKPFKRKRSDASRYNWKDDMCIVINHLQYKRLHRTDLKRPGA